MRLVTMSLLVGLCSLTLAATLSYSIATLSYPSALETYGYDINNAGQIAGEYLLSSGEDDCVTSGFLLRAGNYATVAR